METVGCVARSCGLGVHDSAPGGCFGNVKGLQDHRPSLDDTNDIVSVGIGLHKYRRLFNEGSGKHLVFIPHWKGAFSLRCLEKLRYSLGE